MRTAIEKYVEIDRIIDEADDTAEAVIAESLRQRWEFGRLLLAERVTKKGEPAKRLPNNRLQELVKATGKSETELVYRMKFAESYGDEDELLTAVRSFESWTALRQFLYHKDKIEDRNAPVTADDDEEQEPDTEPDPEPTDEQMFPDKNITTALNRLVRSMFNKKTARAILAGCQTPNDRYATAHAQAARGKPVRRF